MTRTAEALDGLAIAGRVRAGPISFRTPGVIAAGTTSDRTATSGYELGLSLAKSTGPGRRALSLGSDSATLALEYAIPAAEVSGIAGVAEPAGTETWFVHGPLAAGDLDRLRQARPSLVVVGNARTLMGEGEPFVELLAALRSYLGPGPALWAPAVALPHRLPLLAYLGLDLVDTSATLAAARRGRYLDPVLGEVDAAIALREQLCDCPACRENPAGSLESHGLVLLERELRRVRAAIAEGRLRELVEARLAAEPLLAELLRYADRLLAQRLEERTPVVSEGVRSYVLRESIRRPEVQRFRHRLLERYRPPPSKQVLLLLPCSRTKPYRNSRSHRRFASALEGLAPVERVHVVSVTSPLGVVPRELEDTYPARQYDIPVTGEWDADERAAVVEAVAHLLRTGQYRRVVAHLDRDEYDFLREGLGDAEWSLEGDRPTSSAALESLRRSVLAALAGLEPVEGGPLTTVRESLAEVAAVQFGRPAAQRLFAAPARLAGRPWFQRLTDGHGTDLATWREPRGLFQLTVPGAERMFPEHPLEVEVDARVELRGDLFDPGVVAADPAIRTGDAVLLAREGRLLGVGEAALPGPLMGRLGRGLAVAVRHRVAGVVAPAPTST